MSENKKYVLLENDTIKSKEGVILKRIKALVAIEAFGVKAGDLGGYIESEKNLSTTGDAWVADEAKVYGDARVFEHAQVLGNADVSGNAWVYEYASVFGNACVSEFARICGKTKVYGTARVCGDAWVYGDAIVCGDAMVFDDARIASKRHIGWFSGVGEENDTLTWFRAKKGVIIQQGGARTTLDKFEEATSEIYTDAQSAREYRLLIDFIRLRSAGFTYEEGYEA